MLYTANRPPVIKANLGTNLGFTPQIAILTLAGAQVPLTSSAMIQLSDMSMWYYRVADNMTIPETGQEYIYFISGTDGNVITEGEFAIADSSSDLTGAIAERELIIQSVIGIPSAVSLIKSYPIILNTMSADGQFVSNVYEIGSQTTPPTKTPKLTLEFANPSNSAFNITTNMILGTREWVYNWNVNYTFPVDLVKVVVEFESANKKVYRNRRVVELVKSSEFNARRASTGVVI